jgi:hypothetical protein
MPTKTEIEKAREELLQAVMDELAELRQQALELPEQSQIDAIDEAIEFWTPVLREYTDYAQLVEGCGRAIADVTHELAAEKYGWESPEAEAVFDDEDRKLTDLLRWIDQQTSRNRKALESNNHRDLPT